MKRSELVRLRLTPAEKIEWSQAAGQLGLDLSGYIRMVVNNVKDRVTEQMGSPEGRTQEGRVSPRHPSEVQRQALEDAKQVPLSRGGLGPMYDPGEWSGGGAPPEIQEAHDDASEWGPDGTDPGDARRVEPKIVAPVKDQGFFFRPDPKPTRKKK